MNRLIAEVIGTFILVFSGTSAIVVNEITGGTVSHVGIALTFGLVVLALIYTLGEVSGCHLNPAVTVGFFAAGRFEARWVTLYITAQLVGAVLASVLVLCIFPQPTSLGMTLPRGSALQSFALETVLGFILMLVILRVSTGAKEKGITAGIAIGSVIAFEALFAGPISGASMNPARSFGPAVVSGQISELWIYLLAPTLGALIGVFACKLLGDRT